MFRIIGPAFLLCGTLRLRCIPYCLAIIDAIINGYDLRPRYSGSILAVGVCCRMALTVSIAIEALPMGPRLGRLCWLVRVGCGSGSRCLIMRRVLSFLMSSGSGQTLTTKCNAAF